MNIGNIRPFGFYRCRYCKAYHNNHGEDLCDKHLAKRRKAERREEAERQQRNAEIEKRGFFNEMDREQKDDLLYEIAKHLGVL